MDKIKQLLFENQDIEYMHFQASLMPTVDSDSIIGVRVPVLRKIASTLLKDDDFVKSELADFLTSLPHAYYEENFLHAIFLSNEKSFEKAIAEIDSFLPYINNWVVCDCFAPKCFAKNKEALWKCIDIWLDSDKTYTVRFGIVNAMRHFLDDDFDENKLKRVLEVKSSEYYVNMALARYFSVALVKHYDIAIKYLQNRTLDKWVHNKAIQKAIESYRISQEQKEYLRMLKIHD